MTAKIYLSDPKIWLDLQDSNTVIFVTDNGASLELHTSHSNFARVAKILCGDLVLQFLRDGSPIDLMDTNQVTFEEVAAILEGIDKCEVDHYLGWWETSQGAEMGMQKLAEIKQLFESKKQNGNEN